MQELLAKKRGAIIAYGLTLVLAVIGGSLARQYDYFPGDLAIARAVQSIDYPGFATLMAAVTALGTAVPGTTMVLLTAAVLALLGRPTTALFTVLTLSAQINSWLLKYLIGRPRPDPLLVFVTSTVTDNGFPSAHALFFTVFFGFVCYLSWTLLRPSLRRTLLCLVLVLPVPLVGLSRVYLGAHWPSDVLAGYLIGTMHLIALIWMYNLVVRVQRA